jgi:signal transduction histidine kinase
MGEMISMIAHQWRQPLGAISSSVLSIQTKKESQQFDLANFQEREEYLRFTDKKLDNISEYVQVLSSTIDDFRNFFKPNKDKEYVSLTTPIIRALNIVKHSMHSKNIELITEFKNDDKILMYQNEMMQVILNILKNCEDNFIEKSVNNAKIIITSKKEDNHYCIEILDNGGGIAEEILPKIFDPYFSTKDEKNGTGLGLYMSKIMIEEHAGGKLDVFNDRDGVYFCITIGVNHG